jgi:hypothetical protein
VHSTQKFVLRVKYSGWGRQSSFEVLIFLSHGMPCRAKIISRILYGSGVYHGGSTRIVTLLLYFSLWYLLPTPFLLAASCRPIRHGS